MYETTSYKGFNGQNIIELSYVPSGNNTVDIFTKILGLQRIQNLTKLINMTEELRID